MDKLTFDDIRGYKAHLGDESDESMYEEVLTWDWNTPMEVLQSKRYLNYEGQVLDVIFKVLQRTTQHLIDEGKGTDEDFSLKGYTWGFPSKDGHNYYRGNLKDGKYPMISIYSLGIDRYIGFMAHYLKDATEYRVRNADNIDHAYRAEARFFNVSLLNERAERVLYFKKVNITKAEVSQRIEDEYNKEMGVLYGEDVIKVGRYKIRKHINKV